MRALHGTLFYTVTLVPLQVFLPLGLALLLWPLRNSRMQNSYRAMLFSPTIIAYSVAAVMWLWIFNPNHGVLNKVLAELGYDKIRWLSDPDTAIWAHRDRGNVEDAWVPHVALPGGTRRGTEGLHRSSAVGRRRELWQMMRSIRFPLITPTFFFVLVTTVISVNDDVFGAINVLTDGGPFDQPRTSSTTCTSRDLFSSRLVRQVR